VRQSPIVEQEYPCEDKELRVIYLGKVSGCEMKVKPRRDQNSTLLRFFEKPAQHKNLKTAIESVNPQNIKICTEPKI